MLINLAKCTGNLSAKYTAWIIGYFYQCGAGVKGYQLQRVVSAKNEINLVKWYTTNV